MTSHTTTPEFETLLAAVLDGWERGNTALIHLVRLIPEGALAARALPGSPSVAQMFLHLHHERMVLVFENAPEWAGEVDGYHHGQIKLALKAAGCPIPDAEAGPRIWDVWRAR
jgi:hypothetical protein